MSASDKKKYYIRVGNRLFPNLSIGVIVHNIRAGKLLPEHEISTGENEVWTALGDVPELQPIFEALDANFAEPAAPDASPGPQARALRYEVELDEETLELTRGQIITKIKKNQIRETHMVRAMGKSDWSMVGDLSSFSRFFEERRIDTKKRGREFVDTGIPFYVDLLTPFKYFANSRFLFNLIGILAFLFIAKVVTIPIVSGPLNILTHFYLYSFFFRVLSTTAVGRTIFPEYADFDDLGAGLVRPAFQFFLTQLVAALPLLVMTYLMLFQGLDILDYVLGFMPIIFLIIQAPILTIVYGGAIAAVLVVFAMMYFPISLMRQAAYGEFWPTVNMPAVFISVQRALTPYLFLLLYLIIADILAAVLIFLVMLAVSAAGAYAISSGGGMALSLLQSTLPLPLDMSIQAIIITFGFVKMFFIGRYLFQNAERMGWD